MNNQFRVMKIIRTRMWVILLTIVVVTGATAVYSLYMQKPVHEAATRIVVNNTNLGDLKPLDTSQLNANIQLIETYKQIITSSKILGAVAKSHPEFNMNTEQLLNSVKVSSVRNTQIMMISARNGSFDRAVQVANAVTDEFQNQIVSIMKLDNVSVLDRAEALSKPGQIAPDPVLTILLGFVLSLLAAAGIVAILEYSDDTFHTEEDIHSSLGIPQLGTIHTMAKRYTKNTRATKGKAADSTYAG